MASRRLAREGAGAAGPEEVMWGGGAAGERPRRAAAARRGSILQQHVEVTLPWHFKLCSAPRAPCILAAHACALYVHAHTYK